ncbi:HelD family protein [Microlunatus sp. GCM10028923]|uniref:HelD family protein n=1 Tax=Microlunatus sp. GCM10028923 TaxID=3273400 RepID=UPI003609A9E5
MTSSSDTASPESVTADQEAAAILDRELAAEQAHVDKVYQRLDVASRSARLVAAEGRSLYQSDRSSYVREEDGTGLLERDIFAFQAAKRLATLDAEHEGLVFGRLDHVDTEARYIGRIGVRDGDYEPLVIDWRAPAAAAFYRATPNQPMGVTRRRVLRCQGAKVVGIEDDLLDSENAPDDLVVIGDGALLAALSRARGHNMRDIVATIQAEQDEAIRAPWQGFTMISGGPGTGKTVVALHRAAYLLYSNRRRFESGGVLVVGPSQVFMNYIERVLPSLGEESVTLRSVGTVPNDIVEVAGVRHDPAELSAIKGSLRMVRVLRRLVTEPPAGVPDELRLTVDGVVYSLDGPALARIRTDVLTHHKLNQARDAAETALLTALWRRRPRELDLDRPDFDDAVTSTAAFYNFTSAWWPTLSAPAALARLADRALLGRAAGSQLSRREQDLLAADYARLTSVPAARWDWSVADSALLDELASLLGPVPESNSVEIPLFLESGDDVPEVFTTMERLADRSEPDPFATPHDTYAHILVDEAQDISPMQWRMLRRRGGSASWTIVGDPAQSSWPDPAETERAMTELVGTAPVRRFRMSTNYRSPAEVFDLAAKVVVGTVPDADLPTAVRSVGYQPELLVGDVQDTVIDAARELLDQVEGTVGVIAPPSRQQSLRETLADAKLITDDGATDRLVLVTPLAAKGLEYDGAIVVTPDDIVAESPGGTRVLYVALTRPTQRLVTVDAAPGAAWRANLD